VLPVLVVVLVAVAAAAVLVYLTALDVNRAVAVVALAYSVKAVMALAVRKAA
jgi:hypothetical protein